MKHLFTGSNAHTYTFEVTHDSGKFRLKVNASSMVAAKMAICEMEGCPESAVKYIGKDLTNENE